VARLQPGVYCNFGGGKTALTTRDKVMLVAQVCDELKAEDLVILELTGITTIADYFLICTGSSQTHLRAVATEVVDRLRQHRTRPLGEEGLHDTSWILLDYGDVVVHIFAARSRAFYSLETLWGDAKRISAREALS